MRKHTQPRNRNNRPKMPVSSSIPMDVLEALERIAEATNISKAAHIAIAIGEYVRAHPKKNFHRFPARLHLSDRQE